MHNLPWFRQWALRSHGLYHAVLFCSLSSPDQRANSRMFCFRHTKGGFTAESRKELHRRTHRSHLDRRTCSGGRWSAPPSIRSLHYVHNHLIWYQNRSVSAAGGILYAARRACSMHGTTTVIDGQYVSRRHACLDHRFNWRAWLIGKKA